MNLKDLKIKKFYNSDKDKPLQEFYIPVLSVAKSYKRITFSFSSGILAKAASGIAGLITNGGKMQLLAGVEVSEKDYDSMKDAVDFPEKYINDLLEKEIGDIEEFLRNNYVEALAWMLANGLLEIRIGFVPPGNISHMKVGIIEDVDGNTLSFSGSNNETPSGWEHNLEEFKVFRGWIGEEKEWFDADVEKFSDLWEGRAKRMKVFNLPEAISEKVIRAMRKRGPPKLLTSQNQIDATQLGVIDNSNAATDISVDEKDVSDVVVLSDIQSEAIQKWFDACCKGMFEMATGTGKTIAALGSLNRAIEQEGDMIAVVSAPYTHLVTQWESEIKRIIKKGDPKSFEAIQKRKPEIIIASTRIEQNWRTNFANALLRKAIGEIGTVIILITHKSLGDEKFIAKISESTGPKLLIADEAHGLGASNYRTGLIDGYSHRLALSATPSRWFDHEGTEVLEKFFGGTVFEFTLGDALSKKDPRTGETYLTPYKYYPTFVELTESEMQEYVKLSHQIERMYFVLGDDSDDTGYQRLLDKRAQILKEASEKENVIDVVFDHIKARQGNLKHTLLYVNPGEQFRWADSKLKSMGIRYRRFTFNETPEERKQILNQFSDGQCEVVLSMRCLDEGVDIKYASNALILASSTNPREFIQRRGRVLRRAKGKKLAYIYDAIVHGNISTWDDPEMKKYNDKILQRELERYNDFAGLSENSSECLFKLLDLLK